MEKRVCPNGGLELSLLGTGCWAFGGGDYWGEIDQKTVNRIVHASVDNGINYFDTAEVYNEGRSEESLGMAMKDISRDKVLIGSKVNPSNCYRDTLKLHCEESLKRLQTDYLDLYMIHWPVHSHAMRHFTNDEKIIKNPPSVNEAYESLLELRNSGKIRHIGVSNFGTARLSEFPDPGLIAVNQLPYNLLWRGIEFDVVDTCKANGIGVIGYMALLQGILADIYPTMDDIPVLYRRTRHFDSRKSTAIRHGENGFEEETSQALESIRAICKESGIAMSELAIKWTLANPIINCTLIGTRSVKKLEKNISAVEDPLSEDVVNALNLATRPLMEKIGNYLDLWESAENDRSR
ncbi:aldo/keto reductase [Bacteroidota bacterium]